VTPHAGLQYLQAAAGQHKQAVCPVCRQPLLSTDPARFETDDATIDAVLSAESPLHRDEVWRVFHRQHARAELGPALAALRFSETGLITSRAPPLA
jgi:hypothetical protein